MHSMHGCTWLDGAVIRTLDLRSVDRGSSAIYPGQIVHITHVPLSPSSIIWYTGQREVMFGGREDSCVLGVKRWQPADGFVASRGSCGLTAQDRNSSISIVLSSVDVGGSRFPVHDDSAIYTTYSFNRTHDSNSVSYLRGLPI